MFSAELQCQPLFWGSDSLGVWVGLFLIEKQVFGKDTSQKNTSPSQLATHMRSAVNSENKFVAEAEDCMAEIADWQDCCNSESEKCVKVNQTLHCYSREQALHERCYSLEENPGVLKDNLGSLFVKV